MELNKKTLFIDMDGVIVNLKKEIDKTFEIHPNLYEKYKLNPDEIHGIFRDPPPIKNAIKSIMKLHESNKYDIFIATTASWGNPEAATDKRYWIEKHFGNVFHKKMFITHRKDLLLGDFLIDDRLINGAQNFKGTLLHFGKNNEYPNWKSIINFLL